MRITNIRYCVALGILLLGLAGAPNVCAYRLKAYANSFAGTNSTTAPYIIFTQSAGDNPPNGSVYNYAFAGGANGRLESSVTALRLSWASNSVVTATSFNHGASIEEDLQITNFLSPDALIRVTVDLNHDGAVFAGLYGGNGSVLPPPPLPNPGFATANFGAEIDINGSTRMRAYSTLRHGGIWETSEELDPVAVESRFLHDGDKLTGMILTWKRGMAREFWVGVSASTSGELRFGAYDGTYTHSRVSARLRVQVEVSQNSGTSYSVVRPKTANSTFLAAAEPVLLLTPTAYGQVISISGQPLTTHRLQTAASLSGPWTNFTTNFFVPNLAPLTVTNSIEGSIRFFRTVQE